MIKPFTNKDFFSLIEEMNRFEKKNNTFATNIFPPSPFSESWYGASFYKYEVKENKEKIILMTEKQRHFIKANEKELRNMGFDIDNIQTKQDAFKIIAEFKKK